MISSRTMMLSLQLLVLFMIQGCIGEEQGSLYQRDAAIKAEIKGIRRALGSFSEIVQQISEALKDLRSLPDILMSQVKEQMSHQSENIDSIRRDIASLQKVHTCTQEVADLQTQLLIKDQMVQQLNESNAELAKKFADNVTQAETLKPLDWPHSCKHPRQQEINETVQEFISNNDWYSLRRRLGAILDRNSEEYTQLHVGFGPMYMYNVGIFNQTKLASLLLCAGLPVNTRDSYRCTMLHGATDGSNMPLVKFLVERGADVNAKSFDDLTPTIMAAYKGNLELVKYLVQAGANPAAKEVDGHDALYYAKSRNRTEVVQYLQQLQQ